LHVKMHLDSQQLLTLLLLFKILVCLVKQCCEYNIFLIIDKQSKIYH
jgi:hypothetical protein